MSASPIAYLLTFCSSVEDRAGDFVTVAITNGYSFPLRIPYINLDPVLLRPSATSAFGGSKL